VILFFKTRRYLKKQRPITFRGHWLLSLYRTLMLSIVQKGVKYVAGVTALFFHKYLGVQGQSPC
jgi:hypothetical protein